MPEVIFNGPAGRLEGRYQPSKEKSAPIAIEGIASSSSGSFTDHGDSCGSCGP
mgnify:CR=1 FL=1